MNPPPASRNSPPVLDALELCNSCRAERALRGSPAGYCLTCEREARGAANIRLTLLFYDDPVPHWTGSLDEFLDSNAATLEDDDLLGLLSLAVGEAVEFGGGAAPIQVLTRIA